MARRASEWVVCAATSASVVEHLVVAAALVAGGRLVRVGVGDVLAEALKGKIRHALNLLDGEVTEGVSALGDDGAFSFNGAVGDLGARDLRTRRFACTRTTGTGDRNSVAKQLT